MSRKSIPRSIFSFKPIRRKSIAAYDPESGVRCGPAKLNSETSSPSSLLSVCSNLAIEACTIEVNASSSVDSTSASITPTLYRWVVAGAGNTGYAAATTCTGRAPVSGRRRRLAGSPRARR